MLQQTVVRDLATNPVGVMSIVEAATALDVSVARVNELVLTGGLAGRIEDQRVMHVDRASIMRMLLS